MAQAIIKGLLQQGLAAEKIIATCGTPDNAEKIQREFGIACSNDNQQAVQHADIVVLAVKPQVLQAVCEQLKPAIKPNTLILSVAAGVRASDIANWLGQSAIARSMPNTPSAVGMGASGLYCKPECNPEQRTHCRNILEAVGLCVDLTDEAQIDAVTAVSGSGPAYFFLFIEAIRDAGVKLGLNADTALSLALQTARGAAELAQQSELDVGELRRRVTSPNGTTERAIQSFETNRLHNIVEQDMQACAQRAAELSDQLGDKK